MLQLLIVSGLIGSAPQSASAPPGAEGRAPYVVDDPQTASLAIPRYIQCLTTQAPKVALGSPTFALFELEMRSACNKKRVLSAFTHTEGNVVPGTPAFAERVSRVEKAISDRIERDNVPVTKIWYDGFRAKLSIPRFRPGPADACVKRAFLPGVGNYSAVEAAFQAIRAPQDKFQASTQIADQRKRAFDSVLRLVEQDSGRAVVYRRFPVQLAGGTSGIFGNYNADAVTLSVSIESRSAKLYDRDYNPTGMLTTRIETTRGASYGAQNSFGATARVTDYTSILHVWNIGRYVEPGIAYELAINHQISPAEMKRRAPYLKVLLLGNLEEPYVDRRNVRYRLPTLSNPSNEAIDLQILYAPLRCAVLYDSASKTILAAGTISSEPFG